MTVQRALRRGTVGRDLSRYMVHMRMMAADPGSVGFDDKLRYLTADEP